MKNTNTCCYPNKILYINSGLHCLFATNHNNPNTWKNQSIPQQKTTIEYAQFILLFENQYIMFS